MNENEKGNSRRETSVQRSSRGLRFFTECARWLVPKMVRNGLNSAFCGLVGDGLVCKRVLVCASLANPSFAQFLLFQPPRLSVQI